MFQAATTGVPYAYFHVKNSPWQLTIATLCVLMFGEFRGLKKLRTSRALGGARIPPTKLFARLTVNKSILKPRVAAATGAQYLYVGFSRRNKIPRCSAYDIAESNPVRVALKSWSVRPCPDTSCRHAKCHPNPCTCFWVILLTNRQTDKHRG